VARALLVLASCWPIAPPTPIASRALRPHRWSEASS